jgi:hypothetical protein
MKLSQLNNGKNNKTTWLLAIVIFFSGLSFSSPTAYARERQVNARTELVLSTRNRSSKANSFKNFFFPHKTENQYTEFNHFFEVYGILAAIQLKVVNKIHLQFYSNLMNASFLSQQMASNLPYLVE